jgi:hypothetical protein
VWGSLVLLLVVALSIYFFNGIAVLFWVVVLITQVLGWWKR